MAYFTLDGYDALWQYDSGVMLDVLIETDYVHFAIEGDSTVYSLAPVDGKVQIPSQVLEQHGKLSVYAYIASASLEKTLVTESFYILSRPMPPEYISIPSEVITYPELVELIEDMNTLKAELSTWSVSVSQTIGTPSGTVVIDEDGAHLTLAGIKGEQGEKGDYGHPEVTYDSETKTLSIVYSD